MKKHLIRKCTHAGLKTKRCEPVLPSVFNVFVDAAGDDHGHDGVIPRGDEHDGQTQAHSQEGQSPAGGNARERRASVHSSS